MLVRSTRQFVRKHKTLIACAATAAVTYKITYASTLRGALKGTTDVAYQWGLDNGVLALQNTVLLDFINERELGDDVREFISTLGDRLETLTGEELMG